MGGKSTQTTQIPQFVEDAARMALARSQEIQGLGYMPYMGPEVAVVNPYEQALASNVGGMASAYGLAAPAAMDMGAMPVVTQGGLTGYSSYPAYEQGMRQFQAMRPDQYGALASMTQYDPITGAFNPDYQVAPPEPEAVMDVVADRDGRGFSMPSGRSAQSGSGFSRGDGLLSGARDFAEGLRGAASDFGDAVFGGLGGRNNG